jgi:hypothetical protein
MNVLEMFKQLNFGPKASVPEETKGEIQSNSKGNLNGSSADGSWSQPKVSLKSKKLARSDKNVNSFLQKTATEFRDSKEVLN